VDELRKFEWQSDEQRKGYLALVQYWKQYDASAPFPIHARENLTALFFIQKDHESHQYWIDLVGRQVSSLQDELHSLRNSLSGAQREIESLQHRITQAESEAAKIRTA
jgi:septal ring factor EnvC (AmiA/AmiB activator)